MKEKGSNFGFQDPSNQSPIRQAFPDIYDGLISTNLATNFVTGQTLSEPLQIPDIESACARTQEIYSKCIASASNKIKGSAFRTTNDAVVGLVDRINKLRVSIFLLIEERQLYCAKVLQRSLLDHHLRLLYIHERFLKEKTDSVGVDYNWASDALEDLSYSRTINSMGTLFEWESECVEDLHSTLSRLNPEYKDKTLKEIHEVARTFGLWRIIECLLTGIKSRAQSSELRPYDRQELLAGYFFVYFQLSSFVHGGAGAVRDEKLDRRVDGLYGRRLKLLAFYVFQADLISKCLSIDVLAYTDPSLRVSIDEMNAATEHVTYSNLLRWEGSVGTLDP